MSLITANGLEKSYGALEIFSNISFQLPPGARIAIVGANGIGKTTLLRLLTGEESPSDGQLQFARNISIGYLPQEAGKEATHSLWEECLLAFADLQVEEIELKQVEQKLTDNPHSEILLSKYGRLQATFEQNGGYEYEQRIRNTLSGLGFTKDEYDRPLPLLSGGQRTRALLARLLLTNPDLLIMDEPTNHLDINAVEWLESYLRSWRGAVLIVSHDRYFLDKVVAHIWEMRAFGLESFRGNYSNYALQRKIRWDNRAEYIQVEKARLGKDLEFVRKHIAGGRTLQAKGRLKRLSRQILALETHGFEGVRGRRWMELSVRDRTMGVDDAGRRLKALSGTDVTSGTMKLRLHPRGRSGNIILRGEQLVIGYPDNPLFVIPKVVFRRLDVVAIIGGNGSGKTTFLRTLMEQVKPLRGEMSLGASLDIGYFRQAHEDLDPQLTLMDEIQKIRPQWLPAEVRNHLGLFRFSGDEHFKKVSVLSGGERGRLALAKLVLADANLLLLDEPTNHLDIPSQEVLQEMLAEFDGTVLLVSHDRYLINALATQIWTIDSDNEVMHVFEGRYQEYQAVIAAGKIPASDSSISVNVDPITLRVKSEKSRGKQPVETIQREMPGDGLSKAKQKQRANKISQIEKQIAEQESKIALVTEQIANPPADMNLVQRLAESYERLKFELDQLMNEWETLNK